MSLSQNDFQVLDALDQGEITTQRQLSEHTGISLGQINYVLKRLLEKGLVKIGNFRRNPTKIGYAYLLTPKGIEAKSRLAVRFVMKRLKEYHDLKDRLVNRLEFFESQEGRSRILFVGPSTMKEFLEFVILDRDMNLRLVAHCRKASEFSNIEQASYDVALFFDEDIESLKAIRSVTPGAKDRIFSLW